VSSLIFLGFSVIMFIVAYGVMFTIAPMVLGAVWSVMDGMEIMNESWQQVYDDTKATTQYLVPLIPTIGIFILVIKVFMVASARGRD
tara:strand:+ start:59 stop:319 length:261 start_codon:yes stop_codon:yes gene_type:complete